MKKSYLFLSFLCFILCVSCDKSAQQQDWATFKKDTYRSANARVYLDLKTLGKAWEHKAPQPVPAWYGPAKEDAYAVSGPLPSMRDYDVSYYPIVVGNKLFYGSSSDNALHCLDARTGAEKWTYVTGGPIRIAPTYYKGNIYVGSDDGYAYCLDAADGTLVWKYCPSDPNFRKIFQNNYFISYFPIRTGILVEEGIAYFGASLLPWRPSYFCAVNAKNGKRDMAGTYVRKINDLTLEGAMASTGSKIIQPQGRIAPVFFDKKTGQNKGQISGAGGCFVLVTPEKNVIHAQTSRNKTMVESILNKEGEYVGEKRRNRNANFMSFKGGKEIIVQDSLSFILTDNAISAFNRNTQKILWLKRNPAAHRIIFSGDALYVGGVNRVYAIHPQNGETIWQHQVQGTVYALVAARGALYATTGEGFMYCFQKGLSKNNPFYKNKHLLAQIEKVTPPKKQISTVKDRFVAGPFITPVSPTSVLIDFILESPASAKIFWYQNDREITVFGDSKNTKRHRVLITNVQKDFKYKFQIKMGARLGTMYDYDNFFNHNKPTEITEIGKVESFIEKEKDNPVLKIFLETLKNNVLKKGVGIFVGAANADEAFKLAQQTNLKIFVMDTNKKAVALLKNKWIHSKMYGTKITALAVQDFKKIPITSYLADFVWMDTSLETAADEVIRITKPKGIIYWDSNQKPDVFASAKRGWQLNFESSGTLIKRDIENAGAWTHQYGTADNTAFAGEGSFWGATATDDFQVQWMGRPGPRFLTDRSGRKPSPLAAAGKMFVQGKESIVCVDVYNGTPYWSKDIPEMIRMNVHHDCSNWATDDTHLYVAHHQNILKINHENGNIDTIIPVPQSKKEMKDWGYIAVLENIFVGSANEKGAAYTDYHGGYGWYDAVSGQANHIVMSDKLFAKDKKTNQTLWTYKRPKRWILNPTITIAHNKISFIETRNKRFKLKKGRGDEAVYKQNYLVTLDALTGKILWQRKVQHEPGISAYYMAGNEKYRVVVSSKKPNYYIYTYDAKTGKMIWKAQQKWTSDNHGAHLSRPAILNEKLIVKPAMYHLKTGKLSKQKIPKAGHGCASYALSEQSIFYRGGSLTQFNFDTDVFSKWERIRTGCWVSTVPAQGMVLSPEGSGGCSCGNWLETSIVFNPMYRAPITFLSDKTEFENEVTIRLKGKKNDQKIYYTTDGATPNVQSKIFKAPIRCKETTVLKAMVFITKNGKKIPAIREKTFRKISIKKALK